MYQENSGPPQELEQQPEKKDVTTELLSIKSEVVNYLLNDEATSKYIKAVEKLRTLALKMTKPWDWVKFGNTAHLQDKRLAELNMYLQTLYGVNITILRPIMTKETFKGYQTVFDQTTKQNVEVEVDVIEFIQTGGVKIEEVREREGQMRRVRTIEPITGSCRTDDRLFAKRHGVFLDPAHVQPSMVIKKADANYRGNCYRYIWGLKAMSLDDLKAAGLDTTRIIDSQVKGLNEATPQSKETLNTLDELWTRILRAHNGMADKAREWLKSATGYASYVRKSDGKTVPAGQGYTDIHRVDVNTTGGRIAKEKIEKLLAELEAQSGEAQNDDMENRDTEQQKSASMYMDFKASIESCQSTTEIINIEKKIAQAQGLTSPQMKSLSTIAHAKSESLTAKTGGL